MFRHLASIAEIVEDFESAVRFYRDTLGLDIEPHSDGYATVSMPGVLHFGIWSRAEAAQATYGSPDAVDSIPLGFTVGFEVDEVPAAKARLAEDGIDVVQPAKTEPWGQVTCRFLTPGGSFCEISETPWARRLTKPTSAE